MSKFHSRRAILVLESPWELHDKDANRSSVIPFLEGVAKLTGDTEVHYANFYDKGSFKSALNCLCKGDMKSRIVYIAGHGHQERIAGVKVSDMLFEVAEKSRQYKIDGVLLGTCFVGGNTSTMETYLQESRLRWCIGYSAATYWLDATLVDCYLLSSLSRLEEDEFFNQETVIGALADSLTLFDPESLIGHNYSNDPVELQNAMRFVLQLRGQGQRARNITDLVWEARC